MGSDDLFKKRRIEREQRKREYKIPKANSFLIVTEGKQTEPLYFKGLQKLIQGKIGGEVNVLEIPKIDIFGEGCSTMKLIEKTEEYVNKSKHMYQNIWVVFDKDDFPDFDNAIQCGKSKGYKVAWSNSSFEYWLFLHFNYNDSALHRDDWCEKLNKIFKDFNIAEGKYHKNYDNIYELVDKYGSVEQAIKNTKRRMKNYNEDKKPSNYDPGTTVHLLVEDLLSYIEK